jgi:hypothetical protein
MQYVPTGDSNLFPTISALSLSQQPRLKIGVAPTARHKVQETAIVRHLLKLSVKMVLVLPMQNVAAMSKYAAPSFRYVAEHGTGANSIDQHIADVTKWRDSNPSLSADLEDYCIAVAENETAAVVWITLRTGNLGRDQFQSVRGEAVCTLQWRRKPGERWLCTFLRTIRGPGPISDG